jgi:hypothetical protein
MGDVRQFLNAICLLIFIRMKLFLTIVCLACQVLAYSQISIGKPIADTSALLDLEVAKKGLLLPRLSQTQRMTIKSPGNGLLYYQVSSPEGFYHYKRDNPLSTWQPAMPYTLQQNMRPGNYSLLGSRSDNNGIVMDKGEVVIQTSLPVVSPDIKSLLRVYNSNQVTENNIDYVNLVSFKNMFGLNMWSIKLSNNPLNDLGIYQNSLSGPIQRLMISSVGVHIGSSPFDHKTLYRLSIEGTLKFTGNIGLGFENTFTDFTMPANAIVRYTCGCSSQKYVMGGGGGLRDEGPSQEDVKVIYSGPGELDHWQVIIKNNTNQAKVIRIYAICSFLNPYL